MPTFQTPSGLILERALPPRNVTPNPNPPIGTVGPNVPAGFGDTHVMFPDGSPPIQAQAWDGWPVEWAVPSNYTDAWSVANRVSTVFAAIDLNASIIGSLPVYVTRNGVVVDPPLWLANPAPGLYRSWNEAAEQMIWSYQQRGEIILWALTRYADGSVANFAVLNPDLVDVRRSDVDGLPDYSLLGTTGLDEPFVHPLNRDDVCHIPYMRNAGDLRGTGPLEAVATNLVSAAAAAKHGTNVTTRGGIPWAVLHSRHALTSDEVDALRSQWTDSASRRDGAPAVTSGAFELKELAISPREMALLEIRGFDEARIAVALRVPPAMLGLSQDQGGLTYQSANMIYDFHWRATLRVFTRKIAESISGWAFLGRHRHLRFNPDEYVRPSIDQRANAYATLHGIEDETGRVMNAAEIREAENIQSDESSATSPGRQLYGSQ